MSNENRRDDRNLKSTRRRFLEHLRYGAAAVGVASAACQRSPLSAAEPPPAEGEEGRVGYRQLGRTNLRVSEVGFGGHSWAYKRVPDGKGGYRRVALEEAVEMIRAGLEMGVNFFDAGTPADEHVLPGKVLKRLNCRDKVILSPRCCHRMKGVEADKKEVYRFVDERLRQWQTDYFDLLMLTNTENDTDRSGYWEMSYSIEALEKMKAQGKVRFTGFGCHFTPDLFLEAIDKYGDAFDVCSLPYNVRHRAAEQIMPAAKEKGLGVVTIKPFARGSLLKNRDLEGDDAGLPRDMMAFVLENELVDVCVCGVHTLAQVHENFGGSWTKLTPEARRRLDLAAGVPCQGHSWLERGWLYV